MLKKLSQTNILHRKSGVRSSNQHSDNTVFQMNININVSKSIAFAGTIILVLASVNEAHGNLFDEIASNNILLNLFILY